MTFSERLRELRKENSMTQKQLAKTLNLTANSVCEWENNRSEPNINALIKISSLFNVSVSYLVGEEDDFGGSVIASPTAPILSEEDKKLLSAFHGLDRELQELLWDMIRTWQKNAAAFSPQKHA